MSISRLTKTSIASIVLCATSSPALSETITVIQPAPTLGLWSNAYPAVPTAPEIVDLTGQGGDLENNAPAGKGVVKLQTTSDGSSRSEVVLNGNLGTVGDFISGGSVSYDYYHESGAPNTNIMPSLKFTVLDTTDNNGDGFATFIFEEVYNGGVGAFNTWHNISLDGDTGNFWNTTLYGANGAVYNNTFADWLTVYGNTFLDGIITSIAFGLGSGTPLQTGYIDNVQFTNGQISIAADFEVAAVPLPAALPLYGTGLVLMGLLGWRKRRSAV